MENRKGCGIGGDRPTHIPLAWRASVGRHWAGNRVQGISKTDSVLPLRAMASEDRQQADSIPKKTALGHLWQGTSSGWSVYPGGGGGRGRADLAWRLRPRAPREEEKGAREQVFQTESPKVPSPGGSGNGNKFGRLRGWSVTGPGMFVHRTVLKLYLEPLGSLGGF